MREAREFDVLILGGGPAGGTAALRLTALGHRVALVEEKAFPRPQIGESLSPGVPSLLAYLGAGSLLSRPEYLHGLPARVIWDTPTAQEMPGASRGPGVVVHRSRFDADLLQLAAERGTSVFQPAAILDRQTNADGHLFLVRHPAGESLVASRIIIDARGRAGSPAGERVPTAPPTVALWVDAAGEGQPAETRIEATPSAWIWGSPLPGGRHRVMAFIDAARLKDRRPGVVFREVLGGSRLFPPVPAADDGVQACAVLSHAHPAPVGDRSIRIGEAAFALDPLSSSGVEKAMRSALQAGIAVNTRLRTGATALADDWYCDQLAQTVATHIRWTRDYYRQAWPGDDESFWRIRRAAMDLRADPSTAFLDRLKSLLSAGRDPAAVRAPGVPVRERLAGLWSVPVEIDPRLAVVPAVCVTGDQLEERQAILPVGHRRPVAYLDDIEILPLLGEIRAGDCFGDLVNTWSRRLAPDRAARLAVVLHDWDVLRSVSHRGPTPRPAA